MAFDWKPIDEFYPDDHMGNTILIYVVFPDPDEPDSEIYEYEIGVLSRCPDTGNIDALNTDVDSYTWWMNEWVSYENADDKAIAHWCVIESPE